MNRYTRPGSLLLATCLWLVLGLLATNAFAQLPSNDNGAAANPAGDPVVGLSTEDLQKLASEGAMGSSSEDETADSNAFAQSSINFLALLIDGGALMIPIAVMSLLVVAVGLERLFALRRGRILPRRFRREIRRTIENTEPAAPQKLFQLSERYPSAAARILQDVLQKVGRPISEIESIIKEGSQREADFLYGNVRWLSLAAAVTPLIGLLGTVWGMIIAFYNTTQIGAGTNRAEVLAEGIYVALVTTLGGLAVAIPAAIMAHFFEGRITKMLSVIEDDFRKLVPRFERHEGRSRYDISSAGITKRTPPKKSRRLAREPGPSETPVRPPVRRA